MICLQCESTRIVENVRVVDKIEGHLQKTDLNLEVYENPYAFVFKGTKKGKLRANVCVDCGFVMMSVSLIDARRLEKYKNK